MAVSPIDICNIALAHIGDRRITRMDDDAAITDALVRYCVEFYELARDQALSSHRWSFAKKPAVLVREGTPVIIGSYSYSHVLPIDCLRIMTVYRGSANPAINGFTYCGQVDYFKIIDGKIWSHDKDIAIEYIATKNDPSRWSSHFRAAVARLMAHYLAGVIADNPSDAMRHLELYEKNALPNAQFYDAVQDNSGENDDLNASRSRSPLLMARRQGIRDGSYDSDY